MKEKFEVGDIVMIDMELAKDNDKFSNIPDDEVTIEVEVVKTECAHDYRVKLTSRDYRQYIMDEWILRECDTHKTDMMWHDKERRWFCPFCELE